jgi:hypothetical protein
MSKRHISIILGVAIYVAQGIGQAQTTASVAPCPGYNPTHNTNLACEFATAIPTSKAQNGSLGSLTAVPATFAAQLSNLPVATAVSGTGITFVNGIPTFSTESLGTILTQRGETLGKHRFFLSFNYQRFGFGSVDGVRFKNFDTVNTVSFSNGINAYQVSSNSINLTVDQYTALATFGLTSRTDLTFILPFSTVNLNTSSNGNQFFVGSNGALVSAFPLASANLVGSKSGPGDVTVSVKQNIVKAENGFSMAFGGELRIPTGDETNYLGTGAYGVKPYAILSHRGRRFTPNMNVGYQWNSTSSLYFDPATGNHLNLPGSFFYTGGVDLKIVPRFTVVGEFLGQYVINGPRLTTSSVNVACTSSANTQCPGAVTSLQSAPTSSYAMDNAGFGFKLNPFGGLLVSASAYFKLDDNGLRAKWVPLVGVSYRF